MIDEGDAFPFESYPPGLSQFSGSEREDILAAARRRARRNWAWRGPVLGANLVSLALFTLVVLGFLRSYLGYAAVGSFMLALLANVVLWRPALRRAVQVELILRGHARLTNCLVCGYDLRESPTRCPECGTPVGTLPEEDE